MAEFVQHPAIQALAWALVHFLWQGAAIGLGAWLAFRVVRSASARYLIGVAALAGMLAAPAITVAWLARAPVAPATIDPATTGIAASVAAQAAISAASDEAAGSPTLDRGAIIRAIAVAIWITGVAVGLVRLLGGWIVARRLTTRAVEPVSAAVQALARTLAHRLALGRDVVILQSSRVAVPVMVGWIKPAVVLPVAALAGLTPTQTEAILAHELAHVRRHDFPVNVLQSVAEAMLFFHPAVWWVSARVRAERELCCDDMAVSLCDRVVYATALGDLAALASPPVALAATDGDLLARVRRILRPDAADVRARLTPGFAVGLLAALIAPVAIVAAQRPAVVDPTPVAHANTRHELEVRAQHVTSGQHEIHAVGNVNVVARVDPGAAQERQTADQARERAAAEAARIAELKAHIEALQRAQRQNLAAREQTLAASAREMQAVVEELARQQALHERGLTSASQVAKAKEALALLQAQGNAAQTAEARVAAARAEHERVLQLFEQGLASKDQVAERRTALAALERDLAAFERNLLEQRAHRAADEARQSNTNARQLHELHELLARQIDRLEPTLDPKTPIAARDTLRITIDGEPDLPATYRVAAEGTIRLPFIGAIKVLGLTADQARAAVGKALADRRLGSADQVTLAIVRGGVAR
jgi:beta-lactamase regulating signal transducer with metallopeptidase domain